MVNKDKYFHIWEPKKVSSNWYPPLSWMNTSDSIYYETTIFRQYLITLYSSLIFLGIGEMGPANNIEYFASILILIISLFINAFLFGELANLTQTMGKQKSEYQAKIDSAFEVMNHIQMPSEH